MTQLPRIGDKVRKKRGHPCDEPWTVEGAVQDFDHTTQLLLERQGERNEISAREFWQHWTPATQRTT